MSFQHPDYRAAVADLGTIFFNLKRYVYNSFQDFIDELENWKEKYSKRVDVSVLTVNEQIKIFGIDFSTKLSTGNSENIETVSPSSEHPPLVTAKVRHAVTLLQEKETALSLWRIRKYRDKGVQGTTLNEALHSSLKRSKAGNVTTACLNTLYMMLGCHFYKHNKR